MSEPADDTTARRDLRRVELRGLPLTIANRSNEHFATLLRELALVHAADSAETAHARLLAIAEEVRAKYSRFSSAPRANAEAAAAAGRDAVDLVYDTPADFADDAERFAAVLEEVDELCRAGELVTLVAPPDVVAFRRWVLSEFVGQLRTDATPTRWSSDLHEPAADTAAATTRAAVIVIDDDLDLQGSARVRGEITGHLEAGVTDLVLDVAQCSFIDSVGISLLLTTYTRVRDCGGSVTLVHARESVCRTLRHAGILDLLVREP